MQYLFEHLYDTAREAAGEPDLRDAVRDQVQRLAWTARARERDASVYVVPFGLPSPVEVGATLRIEQYAQAFKRLLEQHEPRLRDVGVELHRGDDPLEPYRMTVRGVLSVSGAAEALSFTLDLPGAR